MGDDIVLSEINDLAEQLMDLKSVYTGYIMEEYARSLWHAGEIICNHPAFKHGSKMDLYKALSERTGLSVRYLENGVQVYKAFPLPSVDEAFEEIHRRLPDRFVITERALLSLVKKPSAKALRKPTPMHTNFKDAIPSSLDELIPKISNASYVRVYYDDETYETFKVEK